jgi:FtsP/CotA-like multicopper oxidase with cupredoxin domain
MYNIPNFHPPGTHWLHAHLHGSTAPQVQEGMAGALILKGDIDRWLARDYGISGDKDKIMILQQLQVDDSNGDSMTLCPDSLTTSINGQCLPNISVEAGEIQHWRLIHAGISASVHFALENSNGKKLDLYEYAKDGINMGRMYQLQDVEMQPGYRSDLLVKMPTPGDDICPGTGDCILDIVDVQPPTNARSFNGAGESREIIGRVTIISSSTSAQQLPPINDSHFAKPYPEITQEEIEASNQPVEEIWFASEVDASTVNGEEFPYGTTSQLTLGEAQVWKVWVGDDQPADNTGNHPFHIHVNPFEVIERDQSGHIYKRYWKDTILINATYNRKDSPVELRSRYDDFTGKFVLHCHNLNHEDAGMMKSVQINP